MRPLFLSAFLVCIVPAVRAADVDNHWKNSKVGDWVEYKMTGTGISGKTKMTITAKDDKEVAYEIESSFTANGIEMKGPVQKATVDLTKDYDAIAAANQQSKNLKIETIGEGKEKLKFGEKEYDTKWTKSKATSTFNGVAMESEYKMWFCKDVPVSGLVRMETTVGTFTSTLELTGTGRGK
jgi:hypothetical protein